MSEFRVGDKVMMTSDYYSKDIDGGLYKGYVTEITKAEKDHYGISYEVRSRTNNNAPRPVFTEDIKLVSEVEISSSSSEAPESSQKPSEPEQGVSQEPLKYDAEKPRMDLIRPEFTLGLGRVLGYGASKYKEQRGELPNYLKGQGFHYSTILASLERHIAQWKAGQNKDEETGRSHLEHAAANLMFLHAYENSHKGIDDRVVLEEE